MSISLSKFDENFLKKIKDYKKVHIKSQEGIYYTIYKNNQKVGVIGFVKKGRNYFLKIGIHQSYRGQNIFGNALSLLVKKHKIRKIYSTIALSNKKSIFAHKKLGFRKIPLWKEEDLKTKSYLLKRNTRMVKSWRPKSKSLF